jgi:hypothetical protein
MPLIGARRKQMRPKPSTFTSTVFDFVLMDINLPGISGSMPRE